MSRPKQKARFWRVLGYDSTTQIFEAKVPAGSITERGLKDMLRALASRTLTPSELAGAFAIKRARIANSFLEVRHENDPAQKRTNYWCGHNPHFMAILVSE